MLANILVKKIPPGALALWVLSVIAGYIGAPSVHAQSGASASVFHADAPFQDLQNADKIANTSISDPSASKAFALSFLLPGLGHRYVSGGAWGGWGTTFALADAGLWITLFGSDWRRNQIVQSYESLAVLGADADVENKDRTFFLNLATYRSSDEFLEVVLRNRAWDQIGYVEDPSYHWYWREESDFIKYRALREDAESLRRRRVVVIASLVANRVISGVMAAWRASRIKNSNLAVSLGPPPVYSTLPSANLHLRF